MENKRAREARTLVARSRWGVLSTNSARKPGYPHASVAPYAVDEAGRPVFLFSSLAQHTRNLAADPHASLFVTAGDAADPLESARVTVFGLVAPAGEDDASLRRLFASAHPEAAPQLQFGDFHIFRMDVTEVFHLGGFGDMGWVGEAAYRGAAPPPL